ncbi:MAG: bacillithiol biosynthesis cysteine-adding enzyme BshC [Melioribacter sp.]|uniref:bacillithiol biosynthesis cysteine-adding enzyme BshC n=1 Tax=Rosettibacter primus TaxID=3111523 RepID=UPI00247EC918|nr:bacillithiol biosynthesis cysteine-adding enzyme BshC [Melioribacter sp.]
MYINFCDIPGQQNLFLDYLYEFDNVRKFYKSNFREQETYETLFEKLVNSQRPHRNQLIELIKKQYQNIRISKQTESNIEALYSNKTFAICTGQQLGIFGGPLYTFYKTITAIKLSQYLKERYDNYQFVPIFWLEGDDHDFEEVRKFSILNNNNELISLKYDDGLEEEINRGCIGLKSFNNNLEKLFEDLIIHLRETEFKNSVIELLKSFYKPGDTFLTSFRNLMIRIFDDYGLIVFNPLDSEVKKLLTPIFSEEIINYRNHTIQLVERSAELEETYHAQVKVKPINLFFIENNERLLIEPVEEEYRLKGRRKKFTKDELLEQLNKFPEKFSPNVLLRPICQDYLFPTAFYIGGPSEISYFAQLSPLYDIYNIVQPVIYPRASATIVEKNVKSIIEKYNLDYLNLFTTEEELITKIIEQNSTTDINSLFENSQSDIEKILFGLAENLSSIDKSLFDITNKTKIKIEENLNYLKTKALELEKSKHEVTIRQLTKARNNLYPNNNLQEREINFIYFANKYGLDILKWIFNELTINKFEHQILEL